MLRRAAILDHRLINLSQICGRPYAVILVIQFAGLLNLMTITEKNHVILQETELWDTWGVAYIRKNYASYCACRHIVILDISPPLTESFTEIHE